MGQEAITRRFGGRWPFPGRFGMDLRRGFDCSGQKGLEKCLTGYQTTWRRGNPLSLRFNRSGAVDDRSGNRREVTNRFEAQLMKAQIV